MTTDDYLATYETMRRRELVRGRVREPAAPRYEHQSVVTGLTAELSVYVRREGLGRVCVSPIDVVLDQKKDLVLQPDIIFVSNERIGIIRGQIWGAPDLTIEVSSKSTLVYDSRIKLTWYRKYGVREYWLVNPRERTIEVVRFAKPRLTRQMFRQDETVQSDVLPGLQLRLGDAFG